MNTYGHDDILRRKRTSFLISTEAELCLELNSTQKLEKHKQKFAFHIYIHCTTMSRWHWKFTLNTEDMNILNKLYKPLPEPIRAQSQSDPQEEANITPAGYSYQHGLTLIPVWISNHIIKYGMKLLIRKLPSNFIPHFIGLVITYPGSVFCLLLSASSDYAQPITGQVTEVTCPVIGRGQPELTPSKRQKTDPGPLFTKR